MLAIDGILSNCCEATPTERCSSRQFFSHTAMVYNHSLVTPKPLSAIFLSCLTAVEQSALLAVSRCRAAIIKPMAFSCRYSLSLNVSVRHQHWLAVSDSSSC
eukprot:5750288-Amphidinium_carterae.1